MGELPTGTVTFLFTDIEGSTRLLHELGDAYADALAEHRRALREVFAAHGGIEVDTQGDAFFYVFAWVQGAAAAAGAAQRALAGGPVRVRMGMHTGTPARTEEGYVGVDVHLGARIAAAGHGGQVLLSRATRDLVDGVELRDLGEHRLKDFAEPVWLFQLGDEAFPPLKTISNTNLPRPASSFVGREREVGDVQRLLRESRLVALTGPGGSGKTRLAIEAASELVGEFRNGVFWVGLATVRDPELVLPAVAQTVGAQEALATHIGEKELLLLLDNLEQVVAVAPELAALVEACPNLQLLVTSRELLRIRGEVEYDVLPLADPEAVELFCARAQIPPGPAIEELCRGLDNMPLALELAAARTKALTPEQILDRLGGRLDLFKGGRDADPRQQTLRATIEWSYDLLTPGEQRLFARLAVFSGGCTLEAAEQVADADLDTLQSLVEKSLVRHTGERFWMLETIREHAVERLEDSPRAGQARQRHADWILGWAARLDVRRADQNSSGPRLREELPNVRTALDELHRSQRACDRLELVSNVAEGMFQLGAARESRALLEDALRGGAGCPRELRARALAFASMQSTISGDPALGARYASDAAEAAAGAEEPALRADLLLAASVAQTGLGNLETAQRLTIEAIAYAEELEDGYRVGDLRNNLNYIALRTGDLALAHRTAEVALREARSRGDHHLAAGLLHNLFLIAIRSGAHDEATGYLTATLEIAHGQNLEFAIRLGIEGAAAIAARSGAPGLAATLLGATSSSPAPFRVEEELRLEAEREARSTLGEEAFTRLSAAGARLSLEEAAERAGRWLADRRGR